MTIRRIAAAALLALSLTPLPASAQSTTEPGTPEQFLPDQPAISMGDARRIAIDNGMVRIEEIELDDGVWQLDGRDADDGEIEIEIDAKDGRVVRLQRDRPESAQIMR